MRPDPDQARDWVREELTGREYQPSLLERVAGWFQDFLDELLDAADGVGRLHPAVAAVVLAAMLVLLAVALARLRPDRARREEPAAVLGDTRLDAAGHRRLAEQARDRGDHDEAVVEALRAIVVGLVERAVLDDRPATTAQEVADEAGGSFAGLAERLHAAAGLFDAVRYGDRRAGRAGADELLDLEETLRRTRPERTGAVRPTMAVPR